jgi:hypothetical protein
VYLLERCHAVTAAQECKKLAMVCLSSSCASEIVGHVIGAKERSKPHVHKLREPSPQQQPDITFKSIVPLGLDALRVQGCHPHPLLLCCSHAAEVGATLVESWQGISLTIVGGEINLQSPSP